MSFVYKNGITFNNVADLLENATNGLYKALEEMGWTKYNEIVGTSGSTDKVYKSTGEDGTEIIYIRITQTATGTMRLRTATYYAASGTPGADEGNEIGNTAYPYYQYITQNTGGSFIGWIVGDKQGVVFTTKQDGYYSTCAFGTLKRLGKSTEAGRTQLNASSTTIAATGTTSITVDDTTGFVQGQTIFILNTGTTTGRTGNLLRCTISSVQDGTTLVVTNDAATETIFDDDALVARDPMPTFLLAMGSALGGYNRGYPSGGATFLYDRADTRRTGTAQTSSTAHSAQHLIFSNCPSMGYSAENPIKDYIDPTSYGEYLVAPLVFVGHKVTSTKTAGSYQLRGYFERLCYVISNGQMTSEDTLSEGSTTWLVIQDMTQSDYNYKYVALRTVA